MNMLDATPATISAQVLIDFGVGNKFTERHLDWSVYVSAEPDAPDQVITVYDTAGITEGRHHTDGSVPEQMGIQFRIRSIGYLAGWKKGLQLMRVLDEEVYHHEVLLDQDLQFNVHAFTRRGSLFPLGPEPENSARDLFTVNYTVTFVNLP